MCRYSMYRYGFALLLAAALLQGCAPVFSDFQSARLVEPGALEVTPAATYVPVRQRTLDVQAAYGLAHRLELRGRLTHVFVDWETNEDADVPDVLDDLVEDAGLDFNVVSVGPTLGLVADRLALHVPAEFYVSSAFEEGAAYVRPALVMSLPLHERLEVNPSVNVLLPPSFVAVNLGLALGDLDRWALRPEVGVLLNVPVVSVGLGFSFRTGGSDGS